MSDHGQSSNSTLAAPTSPEAMAKGEISTERQPFWSKEVKKERSFAIQTMGKGIIMITVILWIALPVFWGSTYLLLRYFSQLTILGIDFETPLLGNQAAVGPILTQMAAQTTDSSMRPHLGFALDVNAFDFPGGVEQVKQAVGESKYWGAIVVYPNCTSTWQSSLQTGNASYDPTGCIGVFYSGARFYQITLLYLAPFMTRFANMIAQQASKTAASQYLSANAGNNAALALAAQVPQAIATPFSLHQDDLRPITAWAVAATFEAALIYYLIFTYIIAVWGFMARSSNGWNQKLSFWHLVGWRIGVPFVFYFWISLNFSLIFLAFEIPTNGATSSGKGFMVLWMLNWVGLYALGIALEGLISLLGPEFVPFTLIIWIICETVVIAALLTRNGLNLLNLSFAAPLFALWGSTVNLTSSFSPLELTERFYRFFRWLPFYHLVEGYKIITYGTRPLREIGLNFGVLLAVSAVVTAFLILFMAIERKQEEKKMEDKSILYE